MRSIALLLAALMTLGLVAGCTTPKTDVEEDAAMEHDHDEMVMGDHEHADGMVDHHLNLELLNDFRVEFKGCSEAGGVSLYDMEEGSTGPTSDFRRKGIQDDTGNPRIGSYFRPIMSESTGIWHISLACDSYSYLGADQGPFEGGWVGVRIFPPEWDTSGIERQYFVADLSFNNGEIVDLIHEATGLHASRNLDTKIEWPMPGVVHTILDDEDHGVFETHGKTKAWEPKQPFDRIRFWMLINPAGHGHAGTEGSSPECQCVPIAFDIENTPGKYNVFEDGLGWLSHSRTDAHPAPQPAPSGVNLPAATGNVGGSVYVGFDRTMTLGPVPQLVLNETWLH